MNLDQPSGRDSALRIIPATAFHLDDPRAWSAGEVLRLLLVPLITAVLFVGGIYWVRLQLPAGSATERDQASVVQVHLLPRPTPAPIPVALASEPAATSVASRTDITVDEPDPMSADTAAMPPVRASTPAETSVPNARPTPSPADAPPSSAAIRFQQALLRHVARYQHYPNAARLGRLHGSVETLFSMRRDGTVLGVWVKTSSGQAVLDREAVDAIRRAQPLPAIPSELPERLNIQVTLMFEPS